MRWPMFCPGLFSDVRVCVIRRFVSVLSFTKPVGFCLKGGCVTAAASLVLLTLSVSMQRSCAGALLSLATHLLARPEDSDWS